MGTDRLSDEPDDVFEVTMVKSEGSPWVDPNHIFGALARYGAAKHPDWLNSVT